MMAVGMVVGWWVSSFLLAEFARRGLVRRSGAGGAIGFHQLTVPKASSLLTSSFHLLFFGDSRLFSCAETEVFAVKQPDQAHCGRAK